MQYMLFCYHNETHDLYAALSNKCSKKVYNANHDSIKHIHVSKVVPHSISIDGQTYPPRFPTKHNLEANECVCAIDTTSETRKGNYQ